MNPSVWWFRGGGQTRRRGGVGRSIRTSFEYGDPARLSQAAVSVASAEEVVAGSLFQWGRCVMKLPAPSLVAKTSKFLIR